MTLRRKMGLQIGAMVVAIGLMGAAALWGIRGLHQDLGSAVAGYEELRQIYEVGSHVRTAQTLLSLEQPEGHRAMREIQAAATILGMSGQQSKATEELRSSLVEAQEKLWPSIVDRADGKADEGLLNRPLVQVANIATEIRQKIQEKQSAADAKRRATLILMSGICAVAVLGAIVLGVMHYRSVARPLLNLEVGVKRIAEGKLDERVAPMGPEEFASLAANFNRMACELDGFYRELEEKVAAKSKELVRSERLASVGYLAAGVAHEINNPMGIIAGYAEFSLKTLREKGGPEAVAEAEKSMKVIAEEAFRCKEIVEKLLSLARPGEENRKVISLGDVAANVVSLVGGLGEYKNRRVTLSADPREGLRVMASEGEMKQVILNLTINALQSLNGLEGVVGIEVKRNGKVVELAVSDNGRGMSGEVLERIFEPFFTAKRGAGAAGTGLGLSISHMIVEKHGGRIRASSDGVGKGSRFVVELPAVET